MWATIALCLIDPLTGFVYAEAIEEITTSLLLLALALLTDKIIAYLMLALAVGKIIDGQQSPYEWSANELLWDIVSFAGAIVLYFYRRKKATK